MDKFLYLVSTKVTEPRPNGKKNDQQHNGSGVFFLTFKSFDTHFWSSKKATAVGFFAGIFDQRLAPQGSGLRPGAGSGRSGERSPGKSYGLLDEEIDISSPKKNTEKHKNPQ